MASKKDKPPKPGKEGERHIRVRKDGFIYEYNEILAVNPACEVVEGPVPEAEEEEEDEDEPAPVPAARRSTGLNLSTEIPEPPTKANLGPEASRGLPK